MKANPKMPHLPPTAGEYWREAKREARRQQRRRGQAMRAKLRAKRSGQGEFQF